MPLAEMSPNIQEADISPRKRSHDEFKEEAVNVEEDNGLKATISQSQLAIDSLLHPLQHNLPPSSLRASPGLTGAGSTPSLNSPSPNTPAQDKAPVQTQTTGTQPAKRKKLTPEEKEAREKEAAEKKKEKEVREKEASERKKEREEKAAAKAAEVAEKRKKKAEEDKIRAEKAQEKEDKKRKLQEEKEKEERKQPKLKSFFGGPKTPKTVTPVVNLSKEPPQKNSPVVPISRPPVFEYHKLFKPFFIRQHTRLAASATGMDEETREAKSALLDEFISGKRSCESTAGSFNVIEIFTLPGRPTKRGKVHQPVKLIMEAYEKKREVSVDTAAQRAQAKLSNIPMKIISFSQDVRPPYCGTATPNYLEQGHMRNLARKPVGRQLRLEYDYDSEAEWQEGDEEGEDIEDDDEDEELDDEDDMEGFLDDSEDIGPARRLLGQTIEPESSGICFEDNHRKGPNPAVYDQKMEFIMETLDSSLSIDPWSTSYWEAEPKKPVAQKGAPKQSPDGAKMAPPPVPNASVTPAVKICKAEILNDVKRAILVNKGLSKVGMVDFVFQQFRTETSRTEVKNTIELVAERKKCAASKGKEWDLKPGHEIAS